MDGTPTYDNDILEDFAGMLHPSPEYATYAAAFVIVVFLVSCFLLIRQVWREQPVGRFEITTYLASGILIRAIALAFALLFVLTPLQA